MKCFVLGAGEGSRLYPLTHHFPKYMLPFGKDLIIHEVLREIALLNLESVLIKRAGRAGADIDTIPSPVEFPEDFDDVCCRYRYSNPVIFFEPLPEFDLSKPLKKGEPARRFTLEERWRMHRDFISFYKKYGYDIVTIPKMSDNRHEDMKLKRERILELVSR